MSVTWYLDDLAETVDVQEDDYGVTKVRDHIVIQIHCKVPADTPPSTLETRSTKSAITYQIGGKWRQNNPKGTGKFVCVGDGFAPMELPSDIIIRRQTWEYFGPWEAAPADWNQ